MLGSSSSACLACLALVYLLDMFSVGRSLLRARLGGAGGAFDLSFEGWNDGLEEVGLEEDCVELPSRVVMFSMFSEGFVMG